MAQALRDGAWPQLEELDLVNIYITEEDMTILAQTLEERPACTNSLRRLKLRGAGLRTNQIRILAHAFGRGACPYLEELDLSYNSRCSYGLEVSPMVHLANAVGSGALPNLKKLAMSHSSVSRRDCSGFPEAFLSRLILEV